MNDRITVSSWALHRTLGATYPDSPEGRATEPVFHSERPLPLLELPAELARQGYASFQLCHFHLPSLEPAYLDSLRDAIDQAGVELLTILIDDGDITHPEHGERDVAWIAEWLQIGEDLGAKRARVIAGKQAGGPELLAVSAERLRGLAQGSILRVETENWFPLLDNAKSVNAVLDRTGDAVGLCADYGNWPRTSRYDELPQIFHRAETCHAKFDFVDATNLDKEDADRLMDISIQSGFKGNYVIVNGGIGESEWDAIDIQKGQILASLL